MKTLNMTQKELAEKAKLSQSLISDIITGKRNATYNIIRKIGEATSLNQDWWFNQRGKAFLDKDAPPVAANDAKFIAEQNELLKAHIKDQQRIIAMLEDKISLLEAQCDLKRRKEK